VIPGISKECAALNVELIHPKAQNQIPEDLSAVIIYVCIYIYIYIYISNNLRYVSTLTVQSDVLGDTLNCLISPSD
jgi:hypothetical protein